MNNQIVNIVSTICCIIFLLLVIYVLASLIFKKHKEKVEFIRGFKKGQCTIIFLAAIPLFCIGHMYVGNSFLYAFFTSLNKIVSLVVLRYDFSSITTLMNDNHFYEITVYICATLVMLNAILFSISLFYQYLLECLYKLKLNLSKKKRLYLFGNNKNNIAIYNSAKKYTKFIIGNLSNQDCYNLYCHKINYLKNLVLEKNVKKFINQAVNKNLDVTMVINTQDEESNLEICQVINQAIKQIVDAKKNNIFKDLHVYVFGDMRYESIYNNLIASAYGCMHYLNKYQLIATNFIENYPLTSFMDEKAIDYETTLIKKDVDINVCMIGFGKTNQTIFLTSVANNQFLTTDGHHFSIKPVNYHIFDHEKAQNNKNLNHNYYRYQKEILEEIKDGILNKDDFLPLPDLPSLEKFYKMDINDNEFYKNIKNIICHNKKSVNFIIIAFGSDLENIDLAQKLVTKRKEWDINNLVIFTKVRNSFNKQTILNENNCYFFADEKDEVYNIDKIKGDIIYQMAKMRNAIYQLEYEITANNIDKTVDEDTIIKNNELSEARWYKEFTPFERESNLYACLSMRLKLNLMGLDYCPKDQNNIPALSEEEYLNWYAQDDLPDFNFYHKNIDDKKIIHYTTNFKASKRTTLAIHEHYRWNSYVISKGFIPATKQMILEEKGADGRFTNGKNYQLRKHGNITTFEGLKMFSQMLAKRDNTSIDSKDVIKYDYQLLDDAYWLLTKNGYKIIKKVNKKGD